MTLSRTGGLERQMLARIPFAFLSKLGVLSRPSPDGKVVGLATGIKLERGIVSVITENPIPGVSTIENVNDHSPRRLASQRKSPKKTPLVDD